MRKWLILLLVLALCGCAAPVSMTTAPETSIPETMLPETTIPETTVPATTAPTEPLHSAFYREGFEVEEILTYFQEVTNQIEYTDGTGDPSLIQKWLTPMVYRIHGSPTRRIFRYWRSSVTSSTPSPASPASGKLRRMNLRI